MEGIHCIDEERGKLRGKRVLLRADLNIPGESIDPNHPRIIHLLRTLQFLRDEGACTIVLSHSEPDNESLAPIAPVLNQGVPTTFAADFTSPELQNVSEGNAVLLENLRFWQGEALNDIEFSRALAALAQVYVNEAFSVSHREHASIVGVPKLLPAYAGLAFAEEVEKLSMVHAPVHPFLFIIGGAKFETKLPLLKKFLDVADMVFVGGALANSFLKLKGYQIGTSLAEIVPGLTKLLEHPKLMLPTDVVVEQKIIRGASEVHAQEKILDIGPQSLQDLCGKIKASQMIVWNGPLGVYESGYGESTIALAKCVAESSATSILGGGDTVAIIPQEIQAKFTFVSMGGGAMLAYLRDGTLPGIEALKAPLAGIPR